LAGSHCAGLVGDQQLGEGGAAALELLAGGAHDHAVLAGPHAGGGEDPGPGVHHAHPSHSDRVVAVVVAEHRDVNAQLLGRAVDRGAPRTVISRPSTVRVTVVSG
jgi:hypothetical protein